MTEYIIGLEASTDAEKKDVVAGAANGECREHDFGDIGSALVGDFDDDVAAEIEKDEWVRYVEENKKEMRAHTVDDNPQHVDVDPDDQMTPWGVKRISADITEEDGEGAHVAVLDTGTAALHEDLKDNLGEGVAVVECQGDTCHEPWHDDHSHGTHTAGTVGAVANDLGVLGVAPGVTLHAVKVLDSNGFGTFEDVAEGITTAAKKGWDVINMSLGGSSGSAILKDALEFAAAEGVTIVASAGNDGPCEDCVGYPAKYPEAIAIGATNSNDGMAGFSSTGPEVELAGPGVAVLSTLPGSNYGRFSGTSMSAPHVSGTAALLHAQGKNREEVRQILQDTAEDLGHGDNEQGHGLVDAFEAADEPGDPIDEPITASVTLALEKAQDDPERGNLNGTVLRHSDETPIEGATVSISGPVNDEKTTDADGKVSFKDIPVGQYEVTANAEGFNQASETVEEGDWSA